MRTSVLKPGLLVSLRTSVRGGVNYSRVDVEPEHADENGGRVARWETQKHVPDAEEFDRAAKARSKARAAVSSACCVSAFGLLCPSDKEAELQAGMEAARGIAEAFNATAALSRLEVFVLVGRIAQDDAEAARAIKGEMRELLDDMQAGIKAADPEAIREAAAKARALGGMLSAEVAGKVDAAIAEARATARELVKRVAASGEQAAAAVVAVASVRAIEQARFAFLDLDTAGPVTPEAPAARGLDLPPEDAQAAPVASLSLPFQLEV